MRSLLPAFFRLPEAQRRKVYDLVRELHREVYPGVWYLELLALERDVATGLLDPAELRRATWWCQQRLWHLKATGAANDRAANEPTWFRRVFARLPESVRLGSSARTLHEIWSEVRPDEEVTDLPDFLDPALLPPSSNAERLIALRQVADRLIAEPFLGNELGGSRGVEKEDTEPPGSLLGLIRTRNGLIRIERLDEFWDGGVPPDWASGWGRDEFGAWVVFRVEQATQRLRWIPPGKFWIGSPEDEEGSFPAEGPRHEVAIGSGFWMFDTPCTQALWQEVMGNNPSRFQGKDRPVESVSWEDCQEFIGRLNARMNGLGLALPSEAQWEYACRAGTGTPRYRENLDEIAWHGGNSGGETHDVKGRAPNGWGLFDTLGNVWEWCADLWTGDSHRRFGKGAAVPASAHRVIRGGSWDDVPRIVRAAYRIHDKPAIRIDYLGFRCAEFRAPGPAGRGRDAERAGSASEQGAEHHEDRAPASGAAWLRPGECVQETDSVSISVLTPIRARTDLETLTIRPITLPRWATAIGRDRYGLWARFSIDPPPPKKPRGLRRALGRRPRAPALAPAPVRQCLRWIPPGRFLMGSPEGEEGRFPIEGPRHEVAIGSGFWMFDAPCTQALWEAVMGAGKNPSRFRGADRPVEQVSWEDCRGFLDRLNGRLEGLRLSLPSEAQWEYACRAGTEAARYHEDLDQIAWYEGNSGGETHAVKGKGPNGWGLYDMLGNVWEWCADEWRSDYTARIVQEESGRSSARCVIRGGSWLLDPLNVRAACRSGVEPSYRAGPLGFRCAEFRSGS
jgi:formylglycine-generating enzyme required for sulfatase activity